MTNNPGGIRWQDGTPAHNKHLTNEKADKELIAELDVEAEQISELVEWILDSMDMSALESFVRENLTEYYSNEVNLNDFENNYAEMKEIKGDD